MEILFHLQDNEKIVMTIKPKKMFIFQGAIQSAILYFIIFMFIFAFSIFRVGKSGAFLSLFYLVFFVFIIGISVLSATVRYTKENYWITNQRVIFRRGFFGYSITSLPLERIVDVVISRSFFQQLFGTPSLHLDTFGSGSVGGIGGNYAVNKGTMFAVDKPEDLQRLILELVKKKRKTEKLSM